MRESEDREKERQTDAQQSRAASEGQISMRPRWRPDSGSRNPGEAAARGHPAGAAAL